MMRPLTIAAGLLLAPMLLAHAQQPAAPATASPAAASTAAVPAASTAAAPAAASTTAAVNAPATEKAAAAAPAPAALKGDAASGKQLTYTCRGCHGLTGYRNVYPTYHVPRIGGQSFEYLSNALTEYREGRRKHPTMQAQAQSFSAQDIADIAAYLSTVTVQK